MAATEIPELSGAELVCLQIRALVLEKLVIKERVVRYDSAMTTPPDGLPHRIASLVLTEFLQTQKSLFKFFGRCMVAIVMKTLSDPESISVGAIRICKLLQLEYWFGPTIPKVLTMTINIDSVYCLLEGLGVGLNASPSIDGPSPEIIFAGGGGNFGHSQ